MVKFKNPSSHLAQRGYSFSSLPTPPNLPIIIIIIMTIIIIVVIIDFRLLSALSFAVPAHRRLSVHLPRQSNNWLLSALGAERGRQEQRDEWKKKKVKEDKKEKKRRKGGAGDLLLSIHPSPLPSLAAAASAPLPPSAPPLPLLDPPSPAGICLLLLLRELFLELGGGGRSAPPSLPRTLGKASGGVKGGRAGDFRRSRQESRGEATPWFTGEQRREEEKRISLCLRRAKQDQRRQQGNQMSPLDEDLKTGAALPGRGPEEPLMEPCLTLQRGVFNQCPTFSICACVCLPLEPERGLLMAAAVMAMVVVMVVVVMMMMRWQWHCSRGFWLSSPCLLKDSLR
uniref:uncharacterized protein n=1 Tax=Semicossyphus pulcher TaxID=241346 RepID=UPI0037E78B07